MTHVRGRRHIASFISVVVVALSAVGCTTPSSIVRPGIAPRPGAEVRMYFAEPRQLRLTSAAGETLVAGGVLELTGTAVVARGDTLQVRLHSLNRSPPAIIGAHVEFVPAARDRLETARRDESGLTVGLLLGALAILILLIAVSGAQFGPGT